MASEKKKAAPELRRRAKKLGETENTYIGSHGESHPLPAACAGDLPAHTTGLTCTQLALYRIFPLHATLFPTPHLSLL